MVNNYVCAFSLVIFWVSNQISAAGDPLAGEQKIQTCAVCHGPNGNSTNSVWPSLAAQHEEYNFKQLLEFKSGVRKNDQMTPMAMPLSEQDMADISAYYALQELTTDSQVPGTVEYKVVELGERIYRAGDATSGLPACMACHGPSAAGNPAALFPLLSGQYADYTATQLKTFKSETRDNDVNKVMRDIAIKMTNEGIEAVSLYIQGLY